MRNCFASELTLLASADSRVILLYGDIGNKLFDEFKKFNPNRAFNCGVAEASMVSIAAGLSKKSFIPFVYTINSFLYSKAFEQIKLDICYSNSHVVLVGTGSGLSYSELGTTHHSMEDLGVLRQLPNLQVFAPSTLTELKLTMRFAIDSKRPSYIRIGKKELFDTALLERTEDKAGFFGPHYLSIEQSSTSAIITLGTISRIVFEVCSMLRYTGVGVDLISFPQIAPPNFAVAKSIMDKYANVVIIEEHHESGALIALFDSVVRGSSNASKLSYIGTPHAFHTGLGSLEEARNFLEISAESLFRRVKQLLSK